MRLTYIVLGAVLTGLGCSTGPTSNDSAAPQIVITAPADQAQVSGQVSIDAIVTDDVSGVDKVRFLVDGVELAVVFTSPYHATWNTASVTNNTAHTIRVEATDVAKNVSFRSIGVTVSRGTQ